MGNLLTTAGVDEGDLIQLLDLELPFNTEFDHQLGQGKILKTVKVSGRDGQLIIKVYVRPTLNTSNQRQIQKLEEHIEMVKKQYLHIQQQWTLEYQPGLIPLVPINNQNKVQHHLRRGYFLGRQYFAYNLLDRFHTPPYLEMIEKKWIAYQLLRAVEQAHNTNIIHGDIKSENILLTTWGWLFLSDFNPFKPAFLPKDNPFQWSQFFEDAQFCISVEYVQGFTSIVACVTVVLDAFWLQRDSYLKIVMLHI